MSSISGISSSYSDLINQTTSQAASTEEAEKALKQAYNEKIKEMMSGSGSSASETTLYKTVSSAAENASDALCKVKAAIKSGSGAAAAISSFATSYNAMLSAMSSVSGVEEKAILKQFQSYLSDNKEKLSAIGITFSSDGKLSVDEDTLGSADTENLSKVFGSSSAFMTKMTKLTSSVISVATLKTSGANAITTLYGKSGSYSSESLNTSLLNAFS